MGLSVEQRFWSKVNKKGPKSSLVKGRCWVWKAYVRPDGYGAFGVARGVTVRAHRFSYELVVGRIPDGLDLDHLCRNRACLRPKHLEPVTRQVNLLRGETVPANNVLKMFCPKGHPYNKENTYIRPDKSSRDCLTCRNFRDANRPPRVYKKRVKVQL